MADLGAFAANTAKRVGLATELAQPDRTISQSPQDIKDSAPGRAKSAAETVHNMSDKQIDAPKIKTRGGSDYSAVRDARNAGD